MTTTSNMQHHTKRGANWRRSNSPGARCASAVFFCSHPGQVHVFARSYTSCTKITLGNACCAKNSWISMEPKPRINRLRLWTWQVWRCGFGDRWCHTKSQCPHQRQPWDFGDPNKCVSCAQIGLEPNSISKQKSKETSCIFIELFNFSNRSKIGMPRVCPKGSRKTLKGALV